MRKADPLHRRVIFYDDAPNFGGHELMTLRLTEYLAAHSNYEIIFIASSLNTELCRRLSEVVPQIKLLHTPYASGRGQWLRSYFSIQPLLRLRRLIRSGEPALLIVIQGGIALSSLGLLAGRLAGVRTVSYLPMTHDESLFAPTPLRARLRQWLVQPFYCLPHSLITISSRMAGYATRRRRGSVRVVENGITLPQLSDQSRNTMRSALGLNDSDRLLLLIGRIEFWQKRHDLAVQSLSIARARGLRAHMLVVGSGPDEQALRAQVQAHGLSGAVHWHGWQTDVTSFYAACDVLLLPSRYEGVPLVMLEAMYAGRKIMAANVDGMADMLPPAWTFPAGDAHALADLLCAPDTAADADHLRRHRELIATRHTVEAFGRRFLQIIDEEVELAHG
jgi:glycosyltransferase involved in cell wall biosynthesis